MAAAYVQSKTAKGSSAAPAATFTSAPTQGNLLVAAAMAMSTTVITMTSTGWTALTSATGGTGGSTRAVRMFYKVAGAGESSIVTMASGNAAWAIVIGEYSGLAATPLNVENAQVNASSNPATTPSVTPTGTGPGLFVAAMFDNSANASVSAETIGGVASNEREDLFGAGGSGTAPNAVLQDNIITAFTGAAAGSALFSANAAGAGAIAAFNAALPGVAPRGPKGLPQAVHRAAYY